MRWCGVVCLWFSHAKSTVPISIKVYRNMAYTPGSYIGLFPFQDGPFSDDTARHKY